VTTTPQPERQENPERLLPLILAISGTGVLTFSLITPTLPDLAIELGVSRGAIGLVQGAIGIPGIFLAVFIGYLSDLKGRRFVAIGSLLIFGLAGSLGFIARSFWPLIAVRALQGVGTSGVLSLGVIVIGDLWPPGPRRRRAIALNGVGLTLTGVVAPVIGGALAEGGVFRPYLVFLIALPLAVWARQLPGRPGGPPPPAPLVHVRAMLGRMGQNASLSDYVGLMPFSVLMMLLVMGFGYTNTPLYLEGVFDVASTQRGLLIAVLSVGSSLGGLSSTRLIPRFSPSGSLSVSFATMTGAFVMLALAPNLVVVGVALFVAGLSFGSLFPVVQGYVAEVAPTSERGAAVGTWVSSVRLGQTIGPVASASILDAAGERTSYWTAAGLAAGVLVATPRLRWQLKARMHDAPVAG